ncbi:helix-turn-helix transcriptional regulator [Cellulomonas sp.]|uniref:helix-turn-helix domain-containing protein n=1 Tax=Cellulomonas sp. TaxID=40001 RepID=UPI001B0CA419|nr:helix-turn-helix transcriptional regulator [Cellulomonas sp.]MBO9556188.1 helix-turn-helix transcriptional regulator [Cellulomonas sp.]
MTQQLTPVRRHPAQQVEPLMRRLVGGILRRRREEQGRTLRDVAESALVSVAYLSEVERGRKEASSEVLVAVCRALGMRLVDLVGAAHAELAQADGRVVVDLTARTRDDLAVLSSTPDRERATGSHLSATAEPAGQVLLLAA